MSQAFKFASYSWTLTYVPFVALNMSRQYSISRKVFSSISSFTVAKTLMIRVCNVLVSRTGVLYTLLFTKPHKKSKGVMSGDLGGHGVSPLLPIHRFGKVSFKKSRTIKP